MDKSDAIGAINGVLVWTSAERYEAMARFYRDTLGLAVRTDRPEHLAFEWPGGMRLTLGVHAQVSGPAADPHRLMMNLAVSDIHAVTDRLSQLGISFEREPSQERWGGWIATFADPDGNLVQLLQPSP